MSDVIPAGDTPGGGVGDPYFTRDQLKTLLGITSDDEDELIDRACLGASRAIENRSGWPTFWNTVVPVARVISTVGRIAPIRRSGYSYAKLLLRDGIAEPTGFMAPGFSGAALYPPDCFEEGRPADAIRLPLTSTFGSYGEVSITAVWGWPYVPADISFAAQLQAQRYYQRKGSPEGVAGSAEWGLTRIPALDPDVLSILKGGGYMRAGIG